MPTTGHVTDIKTLTESIDTFCGIDTALLIILANEISILFSWVSIPKRRTPLSRVRHTSSLEWANKIEQTVWRSHSVWEQMIPRRKTPRVFCINAFDCLRSGSRENTLIERELGREELFKGRREIREREWENETELHEGNKSFYLNVTNDYLCVSQIGFLPSPSSPPLPSSPSSSSSSSGVQEVNVMRDFPKLRNLPGFSENPELIQYENKMIPRKSSVYFLKIGGWWIVLFSSGVLNV